MRAVNGKTSALSQEKPLTLRRKDSLSQKERALKGGETVDMRIFKNGNVSWLPK